MAGLVSQCAGRGSAGWRALSGTGRALALDDVRSRHREPRAGIRAGSACRVAMDELALYRERLRSARPTKVACIVATRCGWPLSNGSPRAAESAESHGTLPPTHQRARDVATYPRRPGVAPHPTADSHPRKETSHVR